MEIRRSYRYGKILLGSLTFYFFDSTSSILLTNTKYFSEYRYRFIDRRLNQSFKNQRILRGGEIISFFPFVTDIGMEEGKKIDWFDFVNRSLKHSFYKHRQPLSTLLLKSDEDNIEDMKDRTEAVQLREKIIN